MQPELLVDCPCYTGENPLWHHLEDRLYWIDTRAGLYRYDPVSGQTQQFPVDGQIGGFTIQADGELLLFMANGRVARWKDGAVIGDAVSEVPDERGGRYNDVIADPQGRVYCGALPTPERDGRLYQMERDGSVHVMAEGIKFSNGLAFSLDRKLLYYADSRSYRVYAFDYDEATGDLANQRVFLATDPEWGIPDGMTVDAEGFLWVAFYDGLGLLTRYAPDGAEERRIQFPLPRVTSLTFAGPDLTDIYVTTAGGQDRAQYGALAGSLFHLDLGIRGVPEYQSRIKT